MKNHRIIFACLFLLVLLAAANARSQNNCTSPVKTEAGLVRGMHETTNDTCVWRGIPYVEPPVGELRWKAPQPMKQWSGVRPAAEFGPRCPQKGMMEVVNADPSEKMSEDCLYLNIWRPDKPGKFPVMFFIHGGGLTSGTGNTEMYAGDRMARAGDVVVVNFNYRLSVLGFLALPALRDEDPNKSVGSYGSLDQVAALKWVHNNIANFGGDPDNVTIFGESAGGWSVCSMLATPLAKGLFSKAIIESGGCEAAASMDKGFKQGENFAKVFKCKPDDLKCLRKIPAEKFLKVVNGGFGGFYFAPHEDGYFLTDSPLAVIRSGNFNNVPLIAGSNKNEVQILIALDKKLKKTPADQYEKAMTSLFDVSQAEADQLVSLYPLSEFDNSPRVAYAQITTDASLACPTYLGALSAQKYQSNVYLYRFDYHDIYLGKTTGAVHSLELPFVFNSLDRPPWSTLLKNYGSYQKGMAQISATMQSDWLTFAKTGTPNGKGLIDWPALQPKDQKMMVFGKDIRVAPFTREMQDRCMFWNEYSKHHAPVFETMGAKQPEDK